jgi:3,4-dihydroxy 2-butanone 4-phosphate synthase/GTP cyclohydrolase II
LKDYRRGKMVVIVDDADRENEGDLAMAADKVTAQDINFMAKYGRGLICVALTSKRLNDLELPQMVRENTSSYGTAFTVSVDARSGTTTGISASDRSNTIRKLLDPDASADDFLQPGHTFPLRASDGGVLVRAGQTEAVVDMSRMTGRYPAGVICEIMDEDGTMARLPKLITFARRHKLKVVTIADLISYRRRTEVLVRETASAKIDNKYGSWQMHSFKSLADDRTHLALVKGAASGRKQPLVRVHSECLTGDALGSMRCDCGRQLDQAMCLIEESGYGVLLYLRQEGRGIGLEEKIKAYCLQDNGLDTVEANQLLGHPPDLREYGTGAQILRSLGLKNIHLLTNNPRKIVGLGGHGLTVVKRIPLEVGETKQNRRYLKTKKEKLGHILKIK